MPWETMSTILTARTCDSGVVIKTEGLTKFMKMGAEQVHALSGIDLEFAKGEYVAIMAHRGPASPH